MIFLIFLCSTFIFSGCGEENTTPLTEGVDTGSEEDVMADLSGGDAGTSDAADAAADEGQEDAGIVFAGCVEGDGTCEDGQVCRGGVCVDPITPEDYASEATGRLASYWSTLQFPSEFEDRDDQDCCFDYNGDGFNDNQLGFLLGLMGGFMGDSDAGIQETLDEAIYDGSAAIIVDWVSWPEGDEGDVALNLLVGDFPLDEETGEPLYDFEARTNGEAEYLIDLDSFDEFGPQVQFNLATIEDGFLKTELSEFALNMKMDVVSPEPFLLVLQAAQIEANIEVMDDGVHTIDRTGLGESEEFIGGGNLGGVVRVEDFLSIFEDPARQCECMEDEPIFYWGYDLAGGSLSIVCNPDNNGSACSEEEEGICGLVGILCGLSTVLAGVPDVDLYACEEVVTEGDPNDSCGTVGAELIPGQPLNACSCMPGQDGIDDSISIGLTFAMTGAEIIGLGSEDEEIED
jgi:hypothetical protein